MTFRSILFNSAEDSINQETVEVPAFFVDLNLDQVIDTITANKQEYNLKPFYYIPLTNIAAIQYRQEIAQDLENESLKENINAFAQKMSVMRRYINLADKLYYQYYKEGWFLEAVETYCDAITDLVDNLAPANLTSHGLLAFRDYLINYTNSDSFTVLLAETEQLKADLSSINYCVLMLSDLVKVRKYEAEIDYSVKVEETFAKFKQGAVKDYKVKLTVGSGMNHIEAQILNLVAKLYPEIFSKLSAFCAHHKDFMNETIRVFDREIQFYLAYLEHITTIKQNGLKFCYPQISHQSKTVYDYEGFDLALAAKRTSENASIVCNDFYLKGKERVMVVSGPNQGGKTTFARTFGQLHYLACLGCPVPGREAQLFLFDELFTHFEKEESIKNLRGKLQDDLVRIHAILDRATPHSLLIMNEIFSSTTLKDAVFLSHQVMEKIIQLDLLGVWVTFIDELASVSEKTVCLVSTVVPENPALRTYKILRRPADGLAYAMSIAGKHGLTYANLKERIKS